MRGLFGSLESVLGRAGQNMRRNADGDRVRRNIGYHYSIGANEHVVADVNGA